jgi:hypothetical protein
VGSSAAGRGAGRGRRRQLEVVEVKVAGGARAATTEEAAIGLEAGAAAAVRRRRPRGAARADERRQLRAYLGRLRADLAFRLAPSYKKKKLLLEMKKYQGTRVERASSVPALYIPDPIYYACTHPFAPPPYLSWLALPVGRGWSRVHGMRAPRVLVKCVCHVSCVLLSFTPQFCEAGRAARALGDSYVVGLLLESTINV